MHSVTQRVAKVLAARSPSPGSWNLRLDKLSFRSEDKENGRKSARHVSLRDILAAYEKARPHLEDHLARLVAFEDCLRRQFGTAFDQAHLVNTSRLLLHLGRANVLENVGLYAEHVSGLPMIPGTAVKGFVSTWACWEQNQQVNGSFPSLADDWQMARRQDAYRILGSNDGDTEAGEVTFLGGFPLAVPTMTLDIVTPHHGLPNPLPNPFLALEAGDPPTLWTFPLIVRPRHAGSPKALLTKAKEWLTDALTQLGVGAKTASGYGRFRKATETEETKLAAEAASRDAHAKALRDKLLLEQDERRSKATAVQAEADRVAALSPEDRAFEEFKKTIGDGTAAAREVLNRPEAERQHILRFFHSDEGQKLLKTWSNEKGKKRIENLKQAGL